MYALLSMKWTGVVLAVVVVLLPVAGANGQEQRTYRLDHTVVRYSGVSEEYAAAIAKTVEVARATAAEKYGFDMPESIRVSVAIGARPRLFTDGSKSIDLTVDSEANLRKPSQSGVFVIYGLCHEIGHMAMYRTIRERLWMTGDAAEGWAHYFGSVLVDNVHSVAGPDLWPDRYDYRQDGTKRLERQASSDAKSGNVSGAVLWGELAGLMDVSSLAKIFKAWGAARIDPTDPGGALRRVLKETVDDPRLMEWWNRAESLLVVSEIVSDQTADSIDKSKLAGSPAELKYDDGKSAGKKSMAGSGHAVGFETGRDDLCLVGVLVYGSRYGYPAPPEEDFHVWLCDDGFKMIKDFSFPYSKFKRGDPQTVSLEIEPTMLPERFMICVGFSPTRTKGVMVHYDAAGSGNSYSGLPGRGGSAFEDGDWMIRAVVDEVRTVDSLGGGY